jgi:hypothetical protein
MFGAPMFMKAAGAGGGFDPSTALVCLDPSDLDTLWQDASGTAPVTSNNNPVARVDNKGAAGGYVSISDTTRRPLYQVSSGLHWLLADGVNDALEIGSRFGLGANPGLTVVAGMRILGNGSQSPRIWALGTTGASGVLTGTNGSAGWSWRHNNGYEAYGSAIQDVDCVVTWRRAAGSTYAGDRFFLNGAEKAVAGSSGTGISPTNTGNYFSVHGTLASGGYSNHRLYGLLLMEVDDDEIQARAEAWMAAKAGVSL